MNTKLILTAAIATALAGCVVTASDHRDRGGYVRTSGSVVVSAPVYVEEGAYYGGGVVTAYDAPEYVWINGAWYYYHPSQRVWVHAHRPGNWTPPRNARVYRDWNEHPMYKAPPVSAPPPHYGGPRPDPRPVAVSPPRIYEEGDRIGGATIRYPGNVDAFVAVGGTWYYFHPSLRVWVHSRHDRDWSPPRGTRVYRSWNEHPAYQGHGR